MATKYLDKDGLTYLWTKVKNYINRDYNKTVSRGEQLVTNGNGMLGDNTNFSSWTFDGAVSNSSPGSFTRTGSYANIATDDFFPVTASNKYQFEFDVKSQNGAATFYGYLSFYDVDKMPIYASDTMYYEGTLTTLTQDLNRGDTVIHLADVSNYKTYGTSSHQRALIFWIYKNSFGYQYPPETYSKIHLMPAWVDDASINKTANTITLTAPWSGNTIPSGTYISQGNSGGTYKYSGMIGQVVPSEWKHCIGYYDGTDYSGKNLYAKFPPGTAYCKVGFLWNYNSANDQIWATNISVKDIQRDAWELNLDSDFIDSSTANTFYGTAIKSSKCKSMNISGLGSNDGTIIWIPFDERYGRQFIFDDTTQKIFSRYKNQSTWSSWKDLSDATTVNGHTINSDVPANAVFTDTTYESKPAASGGTALSLVTTGDKYRWDVAASGGGDVNVIETVKVNGTALTPDANKAVNVILPSNLLNGSATGSLRSIGSQAENSSYTIGTNSLALGVGTLTASQTQIALGKYNVSDSNNTYAVIIGNGTANNARSNALTIDWNGNVSIGNNSKTLTYSIRTYNSLHDINLNANTSGNAGIWDSTTSSWMIYNDTNGKTYLGNSTQIYTDGSSLRSNTFYTNYNIYCGSAIGTGGRTSYTDVSKSGDWISSDGVIDLVRSDTSGGLIQFHYNYSSSVTSTIEEINSGVIHISGTLTAGQAIRSNASSTDYCKLNGHTAMVVGREESRIGAFISRESSTEDLANNSIYLYANSQGRVGIYSIMQEDATAVTILSRENNSNTITFGNSAGNVLTYSYNYSSAPPIVSNTAANHRVSHFYMSTATQLMVYAQGNASSYAAYYISTSSSDIRLKENICDTKVSALPVINSFKLREFDWKNGDGHQKIGMIADEVEEIDPKLAVGGGYDENGEMNIKTIDTFYLIGYLVKAVQELSAEIEELKKS